MRFDDQFEMTIDGRAVTATETFEVVNPATGAVIARVADASRAQLDAAVAAARAALPAWRATPLAERQARVRALAERIAAHAEALAALLTREQGKPLADARTEVTGGGVWWMSQVAGLSPPLEVHEADGRRREVRRVPIGVVGAITPWNFPLGLTAWKVAPALVAGNTLVVKPSPFTPLSVLKLGELARDLLPPGVLNVVTGGDRLGPWISEHPGIDKISFTGSTQTGKAVMRSAAANLKRLTLELGGNDPAIVLPDVDVEALAPRLFWAAFANNGQFCLAAKRLYVHEAIYDRFAAALCAYARTVRVGDGSAPGVQLGPVQNRLQFERIGQLLAGAHARGVRFLLGGDIPPGPGYFVPVAIADNPPDDDPLVTEEAFGPVLPLLRFRDADEVVRRANDTPYGLAASVWGQDAAAVRGIAERLEAGTVWINTIHEVSPDQPFAGHKQSGFGIENGIDGLLEYTVPTTIIGYPAPTPLPGG